MELYTVNEIAKIMKVTRSVVYKWVNDGMPHTTLPSGRKRFDLDEVISWCDQKSGD